MKLMQSLLDFFYPSPPTCAICEGQPSPLCLSCREQIADFARQDYAPDIPGVDKVIALLPYEGPIRRKMHRLKFYQTPSYARIFAKAVKASGVLTDLSLDVVAPVPMQRARYLQRGYNQASLLAKELAADLHRPCQELLAKTKNTPPQHDLNRRLRHSNLAHAFRANGNISNLRVLLVDDILTTGSTVRECAATLKQAGAKEVLVFILTIVLPTSKNY